MTNAILAIIVVACPLLAWGRSNPKKKPLSPSCGEVYLSKAKPAKSATKVKDNLNHSSIEIKCKRIMLRPHGYPGSN